jgi:hypothetical protein
MCIVTTIRLGTDAYLHDMHGTTYKPLGLRITFIETIIERNKQCTYNVILRRIRETIIVMQEQ